MILCLRIFFFCLKQNKKKKDQIIFAIVNKWITDTFSVLYNRLAMGNTVVKDVCKTIGRFDKSV